MSWLTLNETTSPGTPAAGKGAMYYDVADERIRFIKDDGYTDVLSNDGLRSENIVTNGGMQIQQKVAVASTAIAGVATTTRAGVVADRWAVTTSVASNLNWQQVDTATTKETGLESRYYGAIIQATAAKKVMLSQWIVNADMAHTRGKTLRLSIKTDQKVGTAGQVYRLGILYLTAAGTTDTCPTFLTGAWSAANGTDPAFAATLLPITPISTGTENCTVSGNYASITATSDAWLKSSALFTVPATAKNLMVVLFSDNTTAGTTDSFAVSDCSLTIGAETVDFVQPLFNQELLRCQRFYCKSTPYGVVVAASLSVATAGYGAAFILGKTGISTVLGSQIPIQFPVQMHQTPTITYFTPTTTGALVFRHSGASPLSQGTATTVTSSLTDRGVVCSATNEATTNGVIGDLVSVHYGASCEQIT